MDRRVDDIEVRASSKLRPRDWRVDTPSLKPVEGPVSEVKVQDDLGLECFNRDGPQPPLTESGTRGSGLGLRGGKRKKGAGVRISRRNKGGGPRRPRTSHTPPPLSSRESLHGLVLPRVPSRAWMGSLQDGTLTVVSGVVRAPPFVPVDWVGSPVSSRTAPSPSIRLWTIRVPSVHLCPFLLRTKLLS